MANLLNYRYEIFPTRPQRLKLGRVLRQTKIQWNKAVTIRRKLKRSLISGQIEHVVKTCLSSEKMNTQGERRKAIQKFQQARPDLSLLNFDSAARIYDIKNLVGKVLEVRPEHLDLNLLAHDLKIEYDSELAEWRAAIAKGIEKKKLPKRNIYWQMMREINNYSGWAAKKFMDQSYQAPEGISLSEVRFNVSGSAKAIRWNQAVSPKKGQRQYGAIGEPQYKRRSEGFAYRILQKETYETEKIIRLKSNKTGHQIYIKALPDGMRWMDLAYHREIPNDSKVKQITINEKAGRYFAVLSLEVPDHVWQIIPMKAGWQAGIDPGAATALTVALHNSNNGELRHLAIHYEFLDKGLGRLEKMQQALALKQGPRRKRTEKEIEEDINQLKCKKAFIKQSPEEQEKAIAKRKTYLEKRPIRQESSKRWRRWAKRVSCLQMHIANQRNDVLHKISRALAEGCDVVGIGNWEPEREVSYRKKLRALKKKVRAGIDGAAQELQELQNEKSKQGPKGARKKRRGGRDRSIAALRRLVEEKAKRASVIALTEIKEHGSTITCCVCGDQTGPRQDLSVREWRCEKCNTIHNRDLNSGFNILGKTLNEIASAHEAARATGSIAEIPMTQGASGQAGCESGLRATGSSERVSSFFNARSYRAWPEFWTEGVPKALQSLQKMGIAHPLTAQTIEKTVPDGP